MACFVCSTVVLHATQHCLKVSSVFLKVGHRCCTVPTEWHLVLVVGQCRKCTKKYTHLCALEQIAQLLVYAHVMSCKLYLCNVYICLGWQWHFYNFFFFFTAQEDNSTKHARFGNQQQDSGPTAPFQFGSCSQQQSDNLQHAVVHAGPASVAAKRPLQTCKLSLLPLCLLAVGRITYINQPASQTIEHILGHNTGNY